MNNKLLAKIGAIVLTMMIAVGSPFAAYAGTGAGTGGGGSDGTLTGAIHWKSIAYDQEGKAYETFLNNAGWSKSTTESQIRGRVGDLEVCKKSKVIWYINHAKQNKWVYNYSYTGTHGKSWDNHRNGSGTIERPHVKLGVRPPSVAEVDDFKFWDRTENGHIIDRTYDPYTIICSGSFAPPPTKTWTDSDMSQSIDKSAETFTHPYSYTTEIKPQMIEGTLDPIGEKNLHPQMGAPVKTSFGKLFDRVETGKLKLSPAQLKSEVKKAVDQDKKLARGTVTLDAQNKAGMAEGGVLNVYEQMKNATITSNSTVKKVTPIECVYRQTWNREAKKYNPASKICREGKTTTSQEIVMNASLETTQRNTGFYQLLAAHCNYGEFEQLMVSDKGLTVMEKGVVKSVSTSLTSGTISQTAITKKYDKMPAVLDFGDAKNTNPAKAKTAKLGFYNKECAFECSANMLSDAAKKNGADKNIQNSQMSTPYEGASDGYGAVSEGTNSNKFEFFRDNSGNEIAVDLWYPADTANVSYDGAKAKTTTVSRWVEGTPKTQSTTGGKFSAKTTDGQKLFTGSDKNAALKNWETTKFSNSNSTVLQGQHTNFIFGATWASEENKPQVLNFKYEYAPKVSSRIYTDGIGFGAGGSQNVGKATTVSANIDGYCFAGFTDKSEVEDYKVLQKNTGSGTVNELDGKIAEGITNNNNGSKAHEYEKNLTINFVRSTTE